MQVAFDRLSLSIEGERRLVRAASLPYHRLPSQDLWRDRIEKIRACGMNAVDVSYPWNYHSEGPGEYEFTGIRDVERLHDLIEEAGLYLIARPGPHFEDELDLGGLPAWLLRQPGMVLRCRTREGFAFSRDFVAAVRAWFEVLVPRFAARENLILVGVEDGYTLPVPLSELREDLFHLALRWLRVPPAGQPAAIRWARRAFRRRRGDSELAARGRGQSNPYMRELCAALRELGVAVPLFHADLLPWTGRQMDVDLLMLARQPFRDLRRDWREDPGGLDAFAEDAAALLAHRPENPLAYTLRPGAADGWGGPGYETLRERLGAEGPLASLHAALAAGATLISYRGFCGGTSWGYMASPDAYTSHDCAAPVAESGRTGAAYETLARWNAFLEPFAADLAAAEPELGGRWSAEHRVTRSAGSRRYVFLRNPSREPRTFPAPEPERSQLEPSESQLRVYAPSGGLEAVSPAPLGARPLAEPEPPLLPRLERWTWSGASPQLEPGYDDASWEPIPRARVDRGALDIDALGVHYGFIWYRGVFHGPLDRLLIDARHSYAIWINRELVATGDQFQNRLGVGPDGARLRRIPLGRAQFSEDSAEGRNAVVVLVESLGHHRNFSDDGRNPRGIVRIDTGNTPVEWRFRGGLLRGELGLAPLVAFEAVEHTGVKEVVLPHGWTGEPNGVGLYETRFQLEGIDPKSTALGLRFDPGRGKANLYLNGYLLGRYWPERGPQQRFLLPWGVLHPADENHLAISVWKRSARAALGKVRLERLG